jgi:hypothetical protein
MRERAGGRLLRDPSLPYRRDSPELDPRAGLFPGVGWFSDVVEALDLPEITLFCQDW